MVDGSAGARSSGALRGLRERGRIALKGIEDSVWGLCGVAAGVVARGGVARAGGILAGAAEGFGGIGVADGPDASGGSESRRGECAGGSTGGVDKRIAGVESTRRCDVIHGVIGGISSFAGPAQR